MKKSGLKNNIMVVTFLLFLLLILFALLNIWLKHKLFKSLAITFGTCFYHFFMRQIVGIGINTIYHNNINYNGWLFKERKGEKRLYDILKVKKWKGKMPTYSPDSFNPRKHDWEYIVMSTCQAELVHEIIAILSLLPIFMGCVFGVWPVFIITSVLAALGDCIFVILQRYNRPRMLKLLNNREISGIYSVGVVRNMKREQLLVWSNGKGYHYNFDCMKCNREYELITGDGRYGNIGPFECPNCHKEYYATIDDHQDPSLYIAESGKQPASLLDCEGRKRSLEIKYNGLGWY